MKISFLLENVEFFLITIYELNISAVYLTEFLLLYSVMWKTLIPNATLNILLVMHFTVK